MIGWLKLVVHILKIRYEKNSFDASILVGYFLPFFGFITCISLFFIIMLYIYIYLFVHIFLLFQCWFAIQVYFYN